MNRTGKEYEEFSLDQWNSYYTDLYLPNTILIAVGLFIGFSGNVLVILVYQRGLKDQGHGRYFIPMLAKSDLACITVSSVYNIVQITRHVTFPDFGLCKLFIYGIRVILANSTLIMVMIAVSRYQQICKRFKCRVKSCHWKILFAVAEIIILVTHSPTFFAVGTVEVHKNNVTGYMCKEIDDRAYQAEWTMLIYIGVFHVTGILIISVSYALIAVHVFKTYRKIGQARHSKLKMQVCKSGVKVLQLVPNNSRHQNHSLTYRFAFMFFVFFLFLLLAFIPPFVMVELERRDPQYWDKKKDNISKNALLVLRMLYSMNTIVDPFIYGFFDPAFRRRLGTMLFKTKFGDRPNIIKSCCDSPCTIRSAKDVKATGLSDTTS